MTAKLETLLKILDRTEPSVALRALKTEAKILLATDRATDAEMAEFMVRAEQALGGRTVSL